MWSLRIRIASPRSPYVKSTDSRTGVTVGPELPRAGFLQQRKPRTDSAPAGWFGRLLLPANSVPAPRSFMKAVGFRPQLTLLLCRRQDFADLGEERSAGQSAERWPRQRSLYHDVGTVLSDVLLAAEQPHSAHAFQRVAEFVSNNVNVEDVQCLRHYRERASVGTPSPAVLPMSMRPWEYSLTRKWVLALDATYRHNANTRRSRI